MPLEARYILTFLEKTENANFSLIFEDNDYDNLEIQNIIDGMVLKSYRFDKYKTTIKKN